MPGPRERLLTTREVGDALGVSTETVRRLVVSGALSAIHIGRHYADDRPRKHPQWRIAPSSVAQYLARQGGKCPNPRTHKEIRKRLGLKSA